MPFSTPSNSHLGAPDSQMIGVPALGSVQPQKLLFARPTDNQVRGGKVLIVDDQESSGKLIRNHLYSWGLRRFSLETKPARALVTIDELRPDVVILDLRDPNHGLAILEAIRQNARLQHVPVILITGHSSSDIKLKALNAAADDFLTKPIDPIELIARVRNTISQKLLRDQIKNYSVELQTDVLTDELTQIANRRAFDYEIKRRLIEWRRQRSPLSLLLIDVDFFKQVNDNFGHGAGDLILQNVAKCVAGSIREMDLVARYGGEEFAVILPSTSLKDAGCLADRIRLKIQEMRTGIGSDELAVTASIGISNSMNGDDARLIALRADEALYEAKRQGRNRAWAHDGSQLLAVTGKDCPAPYRQAVPVSSDKHSDIDVGVRKGKILALDDEPTITLMVRKLLERNGFKNVGVLNESMRTFQLIEEFEPDLLLMDIQMPGINGLEILRELRRRNETKQLPVIILTSATDSKTKIESLGLGANDVLHKPVNERELVARVSNTLLAKAHVDALADYSSRLEKHVRLRTAELMASRREAIQVLARAAESRDDSSGKHILRVGRYAAIIAEELGFSTEQVGNLEQAAQLHDVGKIAMPDHILRKPGKLTEEEFEFMKQHCDFGAGIIRDAAGPGESAKDQSNRPILDNCNSPVMKLAAKIAESHHEKWDGSGYPRGLKGESIPLEGRITAIADVFDALSTVRCYKDAILLDECFKIIQQGAGSQFDPRIVEAFMRRRFDIMEVFHSYRETI